MLNILQTNIQLHWFEFRVLNCITSSISSPSASSVAEDFFGILNPHIISPMVPTQYAHNHNEKQVGADS